MITHAGFMFIGKSYSKTPLDPMPYRERSRIQVPPNADTEAGPPMLPAWTCESNPRLYIKPYYLHHHNIPATGGAIFDTSRLPLADLHSSSGHHLLPEVVLVISDASIPSSNGLIFTDHDILRDFVKQSTTS